MHVLIVTFALNGLSAETYATMAAEAAPRFAALPGLISKYFLADPATNTYGGIYLWAGRAALEAYLVSETYHAIRSNPHFAHVTARAFDSVAAVSALAAARLAGAAA